MFSVVIPLYNKEAFIKKCVQSVLNQTFSVFEIIVVNDGSTDNSLENITKTDPRLQVISIQHSGVSKARNLGVEKARYSWVAFLDADDWWDENYLEEVHKAIKQFPKYRIFATGRTHVYEDYSKRYKAAYLPKEGESGEVDYLKVISTGNLPPINSSNSIIDKSLILAAKGFNNEMVAHEDHDLWIRLCCDNNILMINKALSFYRKIENPPRRVFNAADFSFYISTLNNVKKNLSFSRKEHLRKYCNRFILYSFNKNKGYYKPVEKKGIIMKSKGLISLPTYWILWILYRL